MRNKQQGSTTGKHYTYALAYPDGQFFYIGKGIGTRMFHHRTLAKRTKADGSYFCHSYKCHTIRKLWADGDDYQEILLAYHATEQDAFLHEITLIILGNAAGKLTNVTDGGGGVTGIKHSREVRQRIGAASSTRPRQPHTDKARQTMSKSSQIIKHRIEGECTYREAATILHVTQGSVRRYVVQGKLTSIKHENDRRYYLSVEQVTDLHEHIHGPNRVWVMPPRSEEHRRNLSKALRESEANKRRVRPSPSAETRANISKALKNRAAVKKAQLSQEEKDA